jgi:hypothetical protein
MRRHDLLMPPFWRKSSRWPLRRVTPLGITKPTTMSALVALASSSPR